jgi:hypothetical protein
MPAELVPNEVIPELAHHVNSPDLIAVLRDIQRAGSILNGPNVAPQMVAILQRLTELGLVDPAFDGPSAGRPYLWVSNGNGSRVLNYLTGIRATPHYEIPAAELATWLEQQGTDRWWNVDGDPLLTGRLHFPCPADELAAELRRIGRPLLVQAKPEDASAKGQVIDAGKLSEVVNRFTENGLGAGPEPAWAQDRFLYLCWKASSQDWLLAEDSETTQQMKVDEAVNAK